MRFPGRGRTIQSGGWPLSVPSSSGNNVRHGAIPPEVGASSTRSPETASTSRRRASIPRTTALSRAKAAESAVFRYLPKYLRSAAWLPSLPRTIARARSSPRRSPKAAICSRRVSTVAVSIGDESIANGRPPGVRNERWMPRSHHSSMRSVEMEMPEAATTISLTWKSGSSTCSGFVRGAVPLPAFVCRSGGGGDFDAVGGQHLQGQPRWKIQRQMELGPALDQLQPRSRPLGRSTARSSCRT